MKTPEITGETFDHKVAAIFENEASATQAAKAVRDATSLREAQIFIVGPNTPHPGWELEPEDTGIWNTLVRSHIWLAVVGAMLGIVFFLILYVSNIPFITQNALTSALLALGFGAVIGMMFAGLITLRPDHMPYVSMAKSALRKGKYVVAIHATTAEQLKEANAALDKLDVKKFSTL